MFGTWIGWIAKTFDYINRLLNASAFGLQGYVDTLFPARCYASPRWILCDRRFFFEIMLSPTVASEPGLCVDVICTSRTQ